MNIRTMTVIHSENVLLQDIYVNNEGNSGSVSSNTDGANTIYSNNIEFARWSVTNGDDSISIKANSTNILIRDSTFYRGLGVAFGSIGQLKGVFEKIENVTVRNNTCYKTLHAAYIKTWTGQQVGYPPNGGGGGLGCKSILTFQSKNQQNNFFPIQRYQKCPLNRLPSHQRQRPLHDFAMHDVQRRSRELQFLALRNRRRYVL